MKSIVCASLKGGCGKTSLAVFLGQALAMKGQRVLVIDLDHNNNLTDYFLRNVDAGEIESKGIYQVLKGSLSMTDSIYSSEFLLDVIPATPTLSRIEIELMRDPGALLRFASALRRLDYDFVIMDTPPSISFALTAALYAADMVLCPVSWSRWTIQGYSLLSEECSRVSESKGIPLRLRAVPSMVTNLENNKLREVKLWDIMESRISKAPSIKNAGSSGKKLRQAVKAWLDFQNLAEELLNE